MCFVALRPGQTAVVMSGWSGNLTTLFLGRPRPKWLTTAKCKAVRLESVEWGK